MFEKIKKVLTFKQEVYIEVRNDEGFSHNAWLIIIATSLLSALGSITSLLRNGHLFQWFLGVLASSIVSVLGFALACHVIVWVGRYFFNTKVNFEEVLRPLGLARVWLAFTCIVILTAFSPVFACISGPIGLGAVVLTFLSWLLATKESLELEWPQTIAALIIGMIVMIGISIIFNLILATFGWVSTSFMSIFR